MKTCLYCNKEIKGRADKRYCNDVCRNQYNNQLNSDENNYVRNVNNILRKNRRILKQLLPQEQTSFKINKDTLLREGFHFKYITDILITQRQHQYNFVYEYGYLFLQDDLVLIVRKEG